MRLCLPCGAGLLALVLAMPGVTAQDTQDVPLKVAGTDVPVPKRTKFVSPEYPSQAQAQGLRGIVILELVIDEKGRVASVDVVRSVPPFDEAAVAAVKQWEYETTRVDGQPVRVRHTLPITFSLRLPTMDRQEGVPELRQGAAPAVPPGVDRTESVKAEVTLHPDGSVADAAITQGASPYAEALLMAVRTWRFAPETEAGMAVSFRVEAEFVPSRGTSGRVDLKLRDPKRTAVASAPGADAASPSAPSAAAPEPAPTGAEPAAPPAPSPTPAAVAATPAPTAEPAPPAAPTNSPAPPPSAAPNVPAPTASSSPRPPAPPVDVIAARPTPPPTESGPGPAGTPTPAPTPAPSQPGFSAVRDITLGPGVPDLTKGRRPIVPPVARMAATTGAVEIQMAVDAAGGVSVQNVTGPEILKEAARQAAVSWSFRRTTADRIYLVATFTYAGDQARAEVRRAQ
jgi:TonB family protein